MATIMVAAAALCFQAGMPVASYIVGYSLAAAIFVNVSTGFCIEEHTILFLT
jgi:hypothetical protein